MDQNSNNSPNDFLWTLLENPANDAAPHVYNLHRLVNDFPQSGILQALLAHASEEKNLKRASAYFSSKALFKLINAPSSFTGVPDERIVIQPGIGVNGSYQQQQQVTHEENYTAYTSEELVVDKSAPEVESGEETVNHHEADELVVDNNTEEYLSHVTGEGEHDTQKVAGEVPVPGIEHHAENEAELVHDEGAHEGNADIAERLTEEVSGGTEGHAHLTDLNTASPEHVEMLETAQPEDGEKREEISPEAEMIHPVAEPHGEIPGEELHSGEENEHPGHESAPEVHEEMAEQVTAEYTEAQLAEQHGELNADKDEPAPLIDLPEEQHAPVVAEIQVEEELPVKTISEIHVHDEIRSEPEITVREEHTEAPSEMPVHEEIKPEPEISLQEEHAEAPSEMPVHEEIKPEPEISLQEEHTEAPSEMPVHEEIKPEPEISLQEEHAEAPTEMPVHEEIKPEPEISLSDDADEIYDEIVGIEDITLGQPGGQYFSFNHEFGAHENAEEKQTVPGAATAQSETEQQDVSKYHDEKMPYTFMWWLDKTRREHTHTYQPYIKPVPAFDKKPKKITDELQQQYFENIFHITSVEELDKSAPPAPPHVAPDLKRKEQVIIERFIKEEPQIKPQSSDKLDNENKAKKSSEDRDELVSETLASIYSDQMLYHKAIASYKKLMLKFPEKSRYFADKIEQLEKKTN